MKFIIFLLSLFITFVGFSAHLTISWTFKNVVEGYDHDNRMEVYLDGKHFTTSDVYKQSATGTVTINVPSGEHTLKLIDFAYYEGKWEEHTIANEYSVDAIVDMPLNLKKSAVLNVVFDIEKESVSTDLKTGKTGVKKKKAKSSAASEFTVSWIYKNIVEGYDHETRMAIYIDGNRKFETPVSLESEGGTYFFDLPKGKHNLRFQTEVYYKGKWEEQLKSNMYSIDAFLELNEYQTKPSTLKLTFDIDEESTSYSLTNQ